MKSRLLPQLAYLLLCIGFSLSFSPKALASCVALVQGQVAFDVESCGVINPERTFSFEHERFSFIRDFSPVDRKNFFDSYRGLKVTGEVARSFAVRSGMSSETGVLNLQRITVFIPPGQTTCQEIQGKRIQALLDEACCSGGGDSPCLLNSSYVLKEVKPLGEKGSSAGHRLQMSLEADPNYRQAMAHLQQGKLDEGIKALETLRSANRLDSRGHFNLALAYRRKDQCRTALDVLEPLHQKFLSGEYWSQNTNFVRHGTLLLARCLAKLKEDARSILVLEGFLLDPYRYRPEIQASISHEDFGWIRTTKAYIDYRNRAIKALSKDQAGSATDQGPYGGGSSDF